MARIVSKFGGTSVADLDRIKTVAETIKGEVERGNQIITVVSAMAGVTNSLADLCGRISPMFDAREYDAVLATGEQVTSALLAMALQGLGVSARSWQGWQIPIRTDDNHAKARITEIDRALIEPRLESGEVIVVPGFQGLSPRNRITTLGRGGSDTSAVALAAAFDAERCDIYTDVDGVYTTDPRIVSRAQKIPRISFEEMLEMASLGAKVLQTRSVEMAMRHNVRLQVLSSFDPVLGSDLPGTLVIDEAELVEQSVVTGIAYSRDEAKITLLGVKDEPGTAANIFGPLADANVNVDMIVQNISEDGTLTDMTFTVSTGELARAVATIEKSGVVYERLAQDSNVAKISIIGLGMRSHAGVAQKMFRALADRGINILVISTSEIKISVLIAAEYAELAVRTLHTAYNLDG